jgi:hypothetical protein
MSGKNGHTNLKALHALSSALPSQTTRYYALPFPFPKVHDPQVVGANRHTRPFRIDNQFALVLADVYHTIFDSGGQVQGQTCQSTSHVPDISRLTLTKIGFIHRFPWIDTFRIIRAVRTSIRGPSSSFGGSCKPIERD